MRISTFSVLNVVCTAMIEKEISLKCFGSIGKPKGNYYTELLYHYLNTDNLVQLTTVLLDRQDASPAQVYLHHRREELNSTCLVLR